MNDFNRGALQTPCLRLDYGFGEQWASVELGDGTGYVRLSDYEKLAAENAKLREENKSLRTVAVRYYMELLHSDDVLGQIMARKKLQELGIEVDG